MVKKIFFSQTEKNFLAQSQISPKLKYLMGKLYQHFNHNPMESPETDTNSKK